jgi:hypothetical protein
MKDEYRRSMKGTDKGEYVNSSNSCQRQLQFSVCILNVCDLDLHKLVDSYATQNQKRNNTTTKVLWSIHVKLTLY